MGHHHPDPADPGSGEGEVTALTSSREDCSPGTGTHGLVPGCDGCDHVTAVCTGTCGCSTSVWCSGDTLHCHVVGARNEARQDSQVYSKVVSQAETDHWRSISRHERKFASLGAWQICTKDALHFQSC